MARLGDSLGTGLIHTAMGEEHPHRTDNNTRTSSISTEVFLKGLLSKVLEGHLKTGDGTFTVLPQNVKHLMVRRVEHIRCLIEVFLEVIRILFLS